MATVSVLAVAVSLPLCAAFFKRGRRFLIPYVGFVATCAVASWGASAGLGYGIAENLSGSLPGTFYLYRRGAAIAKGDLVAYRWRGGSGGAA